MNAESSTMRTRIWPIRTLASHWAADPELLIVADWPTVAPDATNAAAELEVAALIDLGATTGSGNSADDIWNRLVVNKGRY